MISVKPISAIDVCDIFNCDLKKQNRFHPKYKSIFLYVAKASILMQESEIRDEANHQICVLIK